MDYLDEAFTEEQRQILKSLVMAAIREASPVYTDILSMLSGTDTVIVARRMYASKGREMTKNPAEMLLPPSDMWEHRWHQLGADNGVIERMEWLPHDVAIKTGRIYREHSDMMGYWVRANCPTSAQVMHASGWHYLRPCESITPMVSWREKPQRIVIFAILQNAITKRYHPIAFRLAPMPGNADATMAMQRYKSYGHHSDGFATSDEAQKYVIDNGHTDSGLLFQWDGISAPAMVAYLRQPWSTGSLALAEGQQDRPATPL